ncbi:MAG: helix-turn-helix transcriptional regulator [Bacteroidales bacterium]
MTCKVQSKYFGNLFFSRNIAQYFNRIAMKQPELGKKIVELRKEKGLTQEELVDRCNISVRTLQRIETGEVTPRVYTIKTILAALDYDLSKISDKENSFSERVTLFLKNLFLIEIDQEKSSGYLIRQLNIAWIFGIIYFLSGFAEAPAEYYRYEEGRMIFSSALYIIIKSIVLISFFFFQRGFILVGFLFRNYLMKIISYILIFCMALTIAYDIASVFYDADERKYILGAEALTFGAIIIIFGFSLLRLRRSVGMVSSFAGIFEIVSGCFFLTIILFFIGDILLIPAELFEIVILYKAAELVRSKQQ